MLTQQLATDPRHIRARFAGYCCETGLRIHAGELILYCPRTNDVYHYTSKAYRAYLDAREYSLLTY